MILICIILNIILNCPCDNIQGYCHMEMSHGLEVMQNAGSRDVLLRAIEIFKRHNYNEDNLAELLVVFKQMNQKNEELNQLIFLNLFLILLQWKLVVIINKLGR